MNTVDALKDLYKTLCGSDYAGDPNPTDAEMISAIAKDASTGSGSGGGGTRVIKLSELEDITDSVVVPAGAVAYQYEPNLTLGDFRGGIIATEHTTPQGDNFLMECLIYSAGETVANGVHLISLATKAATEGDTMRRYSYMSAEFDNMPAGMLVDLTEVSD